MGQLTSQLADPSKKKAVITDCCNLIDHEVEEKKGLTGVAIKTSYKVVNSVKPDFIESVVRDLLPQFAEALDPMVEEALKSKNGVQEHLVKNSKQAANALLSITDAQAERSNRAAIKTAYTKLRPTAEKHVESAVPKLATIIDRHVS